MGLSYGLVFLLGLANSSWGQNAPAEPSAPIQLDFDGKTGRGADFILDPVVPPPPEPKRRPPKNDKEDISKIGVRNIERRSFLISLFPHEWEAKRTAKEFAKLRGKWPQWGIRIIEHPNVKGYVDSIVQRLAKASDVRMQLQPIIMADSELGIDAMAFPDGHILITVEMILAANSESAFAAVIGHEIGHIAARHSAASLGRKVTFFAPMIPLAYIPLLKKIPQCALSPLHRDMEREADILGIQYAYKAGYNPRDIVSLVNRVAPYRHARCADYPGKTERIAKIEEFITTVLPPYVGPEPDDRNFREMQERLREIL